MALETKALLKSIYHSLLIADDIEECRNVLRAMMDAEDVAYVEKVLENQKPKKNEQVEKVFEKYMRKSE
ncbi:MAG: hypothetical protein FWC91_11630 [Defluviitaleaceae bacterium]|nr:hypothetical protein [Defluviitaleaceae bacterium]